MKWKFLKIQIKTIVLLVTLVLFNVEAGARQVPKPRADSFSQSKKDLLKKVYYDHRMTFYCEKNFKADQSIEWGRNVASQSLPKRALRMEWEHVVPAHAFGQSFKEWRIGDSRCVSKKGKFKGRNCASKTNLEFRKMEADMYNLVPAIGEVNQRRSNHSFAELGAASSIFLDCPMKKQKNKVEPPENKKGDVARIYLYMDTQYPGKGIISQKNRPLFEIWNQNDPVDTWECQRYKRIKNIQGTENPIMKNICIDQGTKTL